MGILDRLHDATTGLLGAAEAPIGFVKDLVVAPFDDKDTNGIVGTFYKAFTNRGGQLVGGLVGPEGLTGSLVGGLPDPLRSPVRNVVNPAQQVMDDAYSTLISRPLSTAITAGSLADRPGGGGYAGLFRGSNWSEAYDIADHRSPGQAAALAFMTKDIENPQQLRKAQASDTYNMMSGTVDAIARLTLDPTQLATAGASEYFKALHVVDAAKAIEYAEHTGQIAKFADKLEGLGADEIRHVHFPTHARGADISTLLAEAGTTAERHRVLRVLMGATDEIDGLRASRADLAGRLDRLVQRREMIRTGSPNGFDLVNNPDDLARVTQEVDTLYDQAYRLERMDRSQATIAQIPKTGPLSEARGRITRSDFYQKNAFAKPLRVAFDMQPHHHVRLDDPSGDIQVWRMLQKSDLPLETQGALRTRYMAASTPGERLALLRSAEDQAVRSIAENAGMTVDDVDGVLAHAADLRGRAHERINSRRYDGRGRSILEFEDDTGEMVQHIRMEQPLYETQLPETTNIADLDEIRKATTKLGQFRLRHPTTDLPEEWLSKFYKVWRPATLLRLGWPFRVIGDEQGRLMAKIGVASEMRGMMTGITKESRQGLGFKPLKVGDYTFEGAFGTHNDGDSLYKNLASSRSSFEKLVKGEGDRTTELYKTGNWQTITPTDVGYAQAWEHAANKQIGQSKLARKYIETGDVGATVEWLQSSVDGQAIRRRLPMRKDLDQWVGAVADQVDEYLPTPELKEMALGRRATHADLEAAVQDAHARPVVHGEILEQAKGTSTTTRLLQKTVDKGFEKLGSQPSDTLSRNPFFDHMYQAEVKRQHGLLTAGDRRLSADDLAGIQSRARDYALVETKDLLYDLAESSRLGDLLRFWAPFYPAWQEVVTRWAGLAVENPAFARRMQQIWTAPEKAGIVTDEHGNVVDEHGTITHAVEGGSYTEGTKTDSSDRNLTFSMPEWVDDIPGLNNALQPGSKFKFAKSSLNLALSGVPSVGPPVVIPLNAIARERPELEASLKWALPFGVQDTKSLLLPTIARRVKTLSDAEDDRSYAYTVMRRYTDAMVDYRLGKRKEKPNYEEAKKDANAFWKMRTVASFSLPVTPQFTSPYQPYIDAYRSRREWDAKLTDEQRQAPEYQAPDDWFISSYGEEFFPLTVSMSKSMDGIPPTLEGAKLRTELQSLVEAHPELGSLIVGAEGGGEFSRAVYDGQFHQRVAPGSPHNEREVQPFDQFETSASSSLGWKQFSKVMDMLDMIRVRRGLASLNVKGGEDLQAIKQATVEFLANDDRYAGWYGDYADTDNAKWDKRINGMTQIAGDKRMAERPEMQGLAEYLEGRKGITAALAASEHHTLTAKDNATLAAAWDAHVADIVERNPAFAALYYRWLQNDPVTLGPVTAAAESGRLVG